MNQKENTLLQDKLMSMKKNLAIMCSLTMDELGVTKQDDTSAVVDAINAKDLTYQKKAKERDRYCKQRI